MHTEPTAENPSSATGTALADATFMFELRRQMLKFATLQLGDAALAEDAVQEALVGALKNAASFGAQAAFKTWVFAILKNKIADELRHRSRVVEASQLLHADEEDEDFATFFDTRGHWNAEDAPGTWGNPDASLQEQHFWRVFDMCLNQLPARQARIFMMREFVEMESREICDAVGLSVSNLNVMLHRARLRLRTCLQTQWFGHPEAAC